MIAGVFVANVAAEVGVGVPPKDDGGALSAPAELTERVEMPARF